MKDSKLAQSARKGTGLTQEEFGAVVGVSTEHVCRWEKGRKAMSQTARTLLRALVAHPELAAELRNGR